MIKKPIRIGLVMIENFALLSYACVVDPMRASNLLAKNILFEINHYSVEGKSSKSSSGAIVQTVPLAEATPGLDYLFVIAGGTPEQFENRSFFDRLRTFDKANSVIGGISGGPVILVKAGLMDDHRMTVHWEHAPYLEQLKPSIPLEKSLFVIDRNRITCAGGMAPLDLMHALITKEFGVSFASEVSDWFIHTTVRKPGETQRGSLEKRYGTFNRKVLVAIELIENHVADPLTLGQLANLVGMSSRHLNRLFRQELGFSAMKLSQKLRLEIAKKLLEETSLSMVDIMDATGYTYREHFSKSFKSYFGMLPRDVNKSKVTNSSHAL